MIDVDNPQRLQKEGELYQGLLTTTAASVYSPPIGKTVVIPPGGITIANLSNSAKWFIMWTDDNGAGMANVNLRVFEKDINNKDYWTNDFWIIMDDSSGSISFEAETDNDLTLTIQGYEYKNLN